MSTEIKTSEGTTFYVLSENPSEKGRIVFLHGGTVSQWMWEEYAQKFFDLGYSTLRYDMYGSGNSFVQSNRKRYGRDMLTEQLRELLEHIQWLDPNCPVRFVGASAGASIAATFMASHKTPVECFVAISPAVNVKRTKSLGQRFAIQLFSLFPDSQRLQKRARSAMVRRAEQMVGDLPEKVRGHAERRLQELKNDDRYFESFFRKLIGDTFSNYKNEYSLVGHRLVPTLVLSGDKDPEVPSKYIDFIEQQFLKPEFVDVWIHENSGHELVLRQPDWVMTRIQEFFSSQFRAQ